MEQYYRIKVLHKLQLQNCHILPSKHENFRMKNSGSFHISAQNIDCGYLLERLGEAVLTSTHNLCFEQKYEKYQILFYLNPNGVRTI